MNYSWVRHYQRYEYVVMKGWVTNAFVADVGCGAFPLGSYALAYSAKMVFAIDPLVMSSSDIPKFDAPLHNFDRVVTVKESVFDFTGKVNVGVAIEVFEHMPNPEKFIKYLARICKYAFITTPLADKTGPTRNPEHIAEYSAEDFDKIVGEGFEIEHKVYQTGDLRIQISASPRGDSYSGDHVVQMVWARSRDGI